MNNSFIADTPEMIDAFMLLRLKGALTLEAAGMKGRGHSAYAMIKRQFGLRGSKAAVLMQYTKLLQDKGILQPKTLVKG